MNTRVGIHKQFGARKKTGSELTFLRIDFKIRFLLFLQMLFTKNVSVWQISSKRSIFLEKNWSFSRVRSNLFFLLFSYDSTIWLKTEVKSNLNKVEMDLLCFYNSMYAVIEAKLTVPDHDGGRRKWINAWFLYTHMVYL